MLEVQDPHWLHREQISFWDGHLKLDSLRYLDHLKDCVFHVKLLKSTKEKVTELVFDMKLEHIFL